jgi:hypothetical protein
MPLYSVASADITHQLLDGEVVAIDFVGGNYYNLRGAAGIVFDALTQGVHTEQLPALFLDVPPGSIAQLDLLILRFVEAGLLKIAENPSPATTLPAPVAWVSPTFDTYTDMQQLLLADPIHDVGEGAWPRDAQPPA